MKFLLLALFVVAATAAPHPNEASGEPVELIVNGVPEGEPLEIGHIVDIKMQQHVDGELASATNVLHPFTAVGIAEAAAAAASTPEIVDQEITHEEPVVPEPVFLPAPAVPEFVPEPVVLPAPAVPEFVPEPVVLPAPAVPEVVPRPVVLPAPAVPEVVPEPVVLPAPVAPEFEHPVVPEAVVLPEPVAPEVEAVEQIPVPAPQIPGEIYNDGLVQVTINKPEEPGLIATLQSWFNLALNYISNGIQTTQQII